MSNHSEAPSPRKLPPTAYELQEGETFVPLTYGETLTEFTWKAVITGIILGIIFGAANTYLGLMAGLTISTSIPVAVLTVVTFRVFTAVGFQHSILESNISQTVGSASSSVASGVLFTIPALFIWGMNPAWGQITLLAMAGGLIGVLFMIPLRQYLIKREHGNLPYPEGMACAEVLVAAEGGGKQARGVFWGIGAGMLFQLITQGLKFVKPAWEVGLPFKASLAVKVNAPLLGVGYILGIRIATVMVAGGALSSLIVIPLINLWGQGLAEPVFPETEKLIRDMSSGEIWDRYIRYIGAGAVATAGVITLIKSIPTMVESFKLGLRQLTQRVGAVVAKVERTDDDLSFRTVALLLAFVLLALAVIPGLLGYLDSFVVRAIAALCIGIFAFFFVTVSSRIVGLVGVTSNPTSGMTIATLLGTSLVFYLMGWTDMMGKATALMVGTAVCIAASIAGDTSQDLKTGFILGATPYKQQIGELVGVITSAGFVCLVVIILDQGTPGGLGGEELPAPQAVLMKLVIDGVLDQSLPWALILIGVGIAGVAALFKIPTLAFAVGVYLPLSTMGAVFCGGLLRWYLGRNQDEVTKERRREKGVLFGSGLVGGGGLTGVVLAVWVVAGRQGEPIAGFAPDIPDWASMLLAAVTIALILGIMGYYAKQKDA
ncbi:MAG: oligopeptide transporter, OPT family [Deltaproteobacteria bacterium]|nr:oligopeptide transporter, OPT family [Deltaproteobacteria bacterium]